MIFKNLKIDGSLFGVVANVPNFSGKNHDAAEQHKSHEEEEEEKISERVRVNARKRYQERSTRLARGNGR